MTLAGNFKNFYFWPNFILNFRKSYQIWGKLAQEQKVTGKKQARGEKHSPPPPPSAYRFRGFRVQICYY